jgi:hypothetical protein
MSTGSLTLTNTGTSSIAWAASKTAFWLTLGSTSGTLAGGTSTSIGLTTSKLTLPPGVYTDTVTVTGDISPVTGTVTYTVAGPGNPVDRIRVGGVFVAKPRTRRASGAFGSKPRLVRIGGVFVTIG